MTYFGIWIIGFAIAIGICAADENNGGDKLSPSMATWIFFTWPLFIGFVIGDMVAALTKLNDKLNNDDNDSEH